MIIQIGVDNDINFSVHVYEDKDGILVDTDWGYFDIEELQNLFEFLNKYTSKYTCKFEFEWVY